MAGRRERAGAIHERRERADPDLAGRQAGDGVDHDARHIGPEVQQEEDVELADRHDLHAVAEVVREQVDGGEPCGIVTACRFAAHEDRDTRSHRDAPGSMWGLGRRFGAAQASSTRRSRKCVAQLMQGS